MVSEGESPCEPCPGMHEPGSRVPCRVASLAGQRWLGLGPAVLSAPWGAKAELLGPALVPPFSVVSRRSGPWQGCGTPGRGAGSGAGEQTPPTRFDESLDAVSISPARLQMMFTI